MPGSGENTENKSPDENEFDFDQLESGSEGVEGDGLPESPTGDGPEFEDGPECEGYHERAEDKTFDDIVGDQVNVEITPSSHTAGDTLAQLKDQIEDESPITPESIMSDIDELIRKINLNFTTDGGMEPRFILAIGKLEGAQTRLAGG